MVNFDDVITEYEATKRNKGFAIYYNSEADNVFSSSKDSADAALISDTYDMCCGIIKQYLETPGIARYGTECRAAMKGSANKIVSFLWFFEHIDGAHDFELFETSAVRKAMLKFCKSNGLPFKDVVEYSEENHIHRFLTEERMKP